MKEFESGEYLAPETEVVELDLRGNVMLNGSIEDSIENPVIGW